MSRRAYLFVYAADLGEREDVRDHLDGLPEVLHWRCDLPNAFYLVSDVSAEELANKIRLLGNGRFIVAEIPENCQGWLTRRSWEVITKKVLQPDATSKAAS